MRQFLRGVFLVVAIACGWVAIGGAAVAWQRPKVGEPLPPLRKSASGEPQLLTPPLDAAPVGETPGEAEEAPSLPLPPLRGAATSTPAPEESSEKPHPSDTPEEIETPAPRASAEIRPLRSITSSTLAQAAAFRGVTPGKTTRDELDALWGEPLKETTRGGQIELEFALPPFAGVQAVLEGGVVTSIVGRYATPVAVETAAKEFELTRFTPAMVRDERGQALGQVYPERGVLFGLAKQENETRVAHVIFETPTAEGFLTRARQQRRQDPAASLADAKAALELAPDNARAQSLVLKALLEAERISEALSVAQTILQEEPDNVHARIMSGRASLKLSRWREAEREARSVVEGKETASMDRAAAQLLLGDVLAKSPQHDVKGAMTHHYEAAHAATAAVQELNSGPERQDALEVAVEAYLAIAADLAVGHWRKREESFAEWIGHAERVVESLAAAEVKEDWLLHVHLRAFEASAASGGKIEPSPYAAKALEMGSRMVAAASDPRRTELQAALGASLLEASQALMVAGKHAAGRNYIFDAQRLLEAAAANDATPRTEHLLGRAYFFRGLDKAVGENDHAAAAKWYAKAAPLLERPLPPGPLSAPGGQGQRLVTMAVSLWEADQREQAVALTEKGLRLIQEAVDRAELDRNALAAPLSNLANMNRLLGNEEKADKYQTRLVDFQTPAEEPKQDQ